MLVSLEMVHPVTPVKLRLAGKSMTMKDVLKRLSVRVKVTW